MKILTIIFLAAVIAADGSMAAGPDSTLSLVVKRDQRQFQAPAISDKTKAEIVGKDPSKALTRAFWHTTLPIAAGLGIMIIGDSNVEGVRLVSGVALMGYGGLVGPSMGNFYAEDYFRGGLGIGMRTVGAFMVARGIGQGMAFGNDDEATGDPPGETGIAIGTAMIFGSALWNILSAPSSAEKYNRRKGITGLSFGYDPISRTSLAGVRITF